MVSLVTINYAPLGCLCHELGLYVRPSYDMKVLLFTSNPTWMELLFQTLLSSKQCYGEVSVSVHLKESQRLNTIQGISVYFKCSQQPFNSNLVVLVSRTQFTKCRKLQ